MKPADLSIPVLDWKPAQWDLICRIAISDKPYVVLEAPTGVGKSVIGLGVARLLGAKSIVLTGQLSLQDQYHDMLELPTVRGRGNFPCPEEKGTKADQAVCTVGGACPHKPVSKGEWEPGCPYYDQKLAGLAVPEAVLNYSYWLHQVNYAKTFVAPDLLICDEAHLIEEELRRFATRPLRRTQFKTLGLSFPRHGDDLLAWKRWAARHLRDRTEQVKEARRVRPSASQTLRREIAAELALHQAATDLLSPDLPDDGWTLREGAFGVEARPVWISPLASRLFLRHAPKILFMSATILSGELFAHQLGIDPEDIDFIRVGCPFPKANRPIYYQPVGRVNAANEESLQALTEGIDALLDQYPTERGLVHTVSYKVARYVLARSRHGDRLIGHETTGEKPRAVADFRATPGAVLVSPSVTTGIDLPYDLCRFQVIAKLSFPDLGDPQIKKRMKLGPDGEPDALSQKWYSWSTACALVQAYGRGVRAEDDACKTHLLDGNWRWFRPSVQAMLPKWFTEAFIKTPSTNALHIDQIFAPRS